MTQIKTFVFPLIVAFLLSQAAFAVFEGPVFRYYVNQAPVSFDPAQFYGSEANHFFSNLYRGLYKYDDKEGLVPENAEKCIWKSPHALLCTLRKDFKWSDGTHVKAEDYVRAFQYLIKPETKSSELAHLLKLKNAKAILAGKKDVKTLGVKNIKDYQLLFEFDESDPEFIAKLTSNVLVPWKVKPDIKNAEHLIVNGPYKIEKFGVEHAELVPNINYPLGNPNRPNVQVYFIDDDTAAQNFYETGRLDLQMRLNTSFIPKYKDQKGFFQKIFSRFDYIGFGPEIQKNENLRRALSLSVNYEDLKTILYAVGRPGCGGLTDNYVTKERCYPFDLKTAQEYFAKVPENLRKKKFIMKFSRAGGDNIQRIMEWYQNQWQKNLGLDVEIASVEQGMYLQDLKNNPPDIFRKGINLDRPTCASALESFTSQDHDNFIFFKNKQYDMLIQRVSNTKNKEKAKKICDQAIKILMSGYRVIPQGLIHFSMLDDGKFEGYKINELNQIDLSDLRSK